MNNEQPNIYMGADLIPSQNLKLDLSNAVNLQAMQIAREMGMGDAAAQETKQLTKEELIAAHALTLGMYRGASERYKENKTLGVDDQLSKDTMNRCASTLKNLENQRDNLKMLMATGAVPEPEESQKQFNMNPNQQPFQQPYPQGYQQQPLYPQQQSVPMYPPQQQSAPFIPQQPISVAPAFSADYILQIIYQDIQVLKNQMNAMYQHLIPVPNKKPRKKIETIPE